MKHQMVMMTMTMTMTQLKYEYLELLEEVKSQPMKERKKLSKLKNDKKLKRGG